MANDDVYRTFTLYTAGILTKEQALEQLKIKKLYDQLVLTSVKALSYLRFVGTVPGVLMVDKKFEAVLTLLVPQVVQLIGENYTVDEIVAAKAFYRSKVY